MARYGIVAPRPAAGVRAAVVPRRPRLPRGDGGGRRTSPGRTATRWRTGPGDGRAACSAPRRRAARARSTTSPTTSRSSSGTAAARSASTGRARRVRSPPARRRSRWTTRGRPAGLHPRQHGHVELRSRRRARVDGAVVRHDLPRRRPAAEPDRARGSASRGAELRRKLEAQGIVVRCPSNQGLAEEAPFAYKDVERVVAVVEQAGLARRVVRLRPLGVVKG